MFSTWFNSKQYFFKDHILFLSKNFTNLKLLFYYFVEKELKEQFTEENYKNINILEAESFILYREQLKTLWF